MITYKSPDQLARMRRAGAIIAKTMRLVAAEVKPGVSISDLDALAEELIRKEGGRPNFKGYKGYSHASCISVNEVVVHGIPNGRVLNEGDIIGLDFGVEVEGFNADSAWTFPVGEIAPNAQRLLNVTKEALMQGLGKCKPGNRVGDISSTIQTYVEKNGYGIVRDLVGHGIGAKLHEEPSIPNFGKAKDGPMLKPGMTFCVEPMVNEGTWRVRTLDDDWTVVTADGKLSAHFEHTIAITASGFEILTREED